MNQNLIHLLMAQGYSFVCATCEKLHRAYTAGFLDGCEAAMAGQDCAGPLAGKDFPLYEGPLTNQSLATMCYRCGGRADKGLQPGGGGRIIGSCNEHYEHVRPQSGKALVTKRIAGRAR